MTGRFVMLGDDDAAACGGETCAVPGPAGNESSAEATGPVIVVH